MLGRRCGRGSAAIRTGKYYADMEKSFFLHTSSISYKSMLPTGATRPSPRLFHSAGAKITWRERVPYDKGDDSVGEKRAFWET